jgi:orotidine-5'-phosphate decarboxylase
VAGSGQPSDPASGPAGGQAGAGAGEQSGEQTFRPGSRLIAALDVPDRASADALVARLGGAVDWLKIGLELYVATGPDIVRDYAAAGHRVMLDLKLHDIPATVARATERAAELGAELLTVHASGGRAMLRAAVDAAHAAHRASPGGRRLRILAVTVLTSLDETDLVEAGLQGPADALVMRRAELAAQAGCDGVVASPHEALRLRAAMPGSFLIVTPGIRPAGASTDDQKRVSTAAAARAAGADLVVCGRPIRDAADPAAAARALIAELAGRAPRATPND